jgi:hypothetical protein
MARLLIGVKPGPSRIRLDEGSYGLRSQTLISEMAVTVDGPEQRAIGDAQVLDPCPLGPDWAGRGH